MNKKLLSLILSIIMLLLMVNMVSAADHQLGLGFYDSNNGGWYNHYCLSGKYILSKQTAVQGLLAGNYLGVKGMYNLKNDPNYNFYGYGKAGFFFNWGVEIGAGAGIEYFLFKALKATDVKELERIGFMLDLGIDVQLYDYDVNKHSSSSGLGFGAGIHYYF